MATALSQFRSRISRHVPGCPLPFIDKTVRDAAIQFCKDTLIWTISFEVRDVLYTAVNSSDNDSITLNIYDYDDTGDVSVDDDGGVAFSDNYASYDPILVSELQIDRAPFSITYAKFENDITDLDPGGYKFFNFPSRYTVKIFPLDEYADAETNFDVYLKLAVKPTTITTVVEDTLYYDHQEAIAAYALYLLFGTPGRQWSNPEEMARSYANYQHEMGRARIKINKGFTDAGSMITGGYF
jgi:hypothetical protein